MSIAVITNTRLIDWVEQYALTHEISDDTASHYRLAIHTAERYANQPLASGTICDRLVNGLLVAMLREGKSPHYVRTVKSAVMAIWRDMAEARMCSPPIKIRTVRSPARSPTIWTPEQVGRLLGAARQAQGEFRGTGLSRAWYWETLLLVAWDSGLRRRDLHRLRRRDLALDFVWVQNKTRKPVRVQLRASTLSRIEAWGRGSDATLWPLWGACASWDQAWKRLVVASGIPYGPFKRLRKSAGTAAEQACPGAGHLLLGNTRMVFERNYLDPMRVAPPRPPEIG